MDFVISARVHTNMLSMVSHTTIIPIEASDFRLAELLEGFEYPTYHQAHQPVGLKRLLQWSIRSCGTTALLTTITNNRFQETRKNAG